MAVICLLHGAWHDGSCWERTSAALRTRGHVALAPDLPLHHPLTSVEDRIRPAAEAIDAALRSTRGGGERVVVVGHSMGAGYAPLLVAERPASLAVYLCPGLGPLRRGFPWPAAGADGTSVWAADAAIAAMYRRLDPAVAAELAARLRPMAPPSDGRPGRPALPRVYEVAVVIAAEDELFDPDSETARARERLETDPVRISGGHFPMIEDPDGLAVLLDRLASRSSDGTPAGR